jgi:branched-chain amino acid transport system permease protein
MQTLISGLSDGAIYGLIALGMSVTFYVTRVINFAQGQLLMAAVMTISEGATAGWPLWMSIVAAFAVAAVISVLTYVIAIAPILRINRSSIIWIASTLGVSLILENGAAGLFGSDTIPFPPLLEDYSIHVGGLTISWQTILALGLAVLIVIAFEFVRRRTIIGKAGRAVALDPEMASAVGVNTSVMAAGAFAVSGMLCAVAGVLLGPSSFANPYMGGTYAVFGFMAFIVSKTNHPVTALYAGVAIGVITEEANALINPNAGSWFPFVVVLVLLVLRPAWMLADGQARSQTRARRPVLRVIGGLRGR